MAISTDPIPAAHQFGKQLVRTPDGAYILRSDPGSFFSRDRFLPEGQVSDELKALFHVCDTDVIGQDMWGIWHPMPPTSVHASRKREADVVALEATARAARAELERAKQLFQERTRETEDQRRRRLAAAVVGELIGSLAGALGRR